MLTKVSDGKVVCSFSNRKCGNMSLFYGNTKDALANRNRFLASLKIDYRNLTCAKQVHGSNIRVVTEKEKGSGALTYDDAISDTDSLITNKPNLPIAVFTADCLSVFLYDRSKSAIGVVHAGWKSTKENILIKTVGLMQKEFGTKVNNLSAELGPCIRNCCCQVGEEFKGFFTAGSLLNKNGKFYLDLPAINKKQLLDAGLEENNIFDSSSCTYCGSKDFFSFRKEAKNSGRMMSVIMLRG